MAFTKDKTFSDGTSQFIVRDARALPLSGGTMTGEIHSSYTDIPFQHHSPVKDNVLAFGVGAGGDNRGIYNYLPNYDGWILYWNSSGLCYINVFNENTTDKKTFVLNVNGQITFGGNHVPVVTKWTSGLSWYRVYSDGWIEQGGFINSDASTRTLVTLHKPFSNTNYSIFCNAQYTTKMSSTLAVSSNTSYPKSTSNFYIYDSDNANVDFYWRACGY